MQFSLMGVNRSLYDDENKYSIHLNMTIEKKWCVDCGECVFHDNEFLTCQLMDNIKEQIEDTLDFGYDDYDIYGDIFNGFNENKMCPLEFKIYRPRRNPFYLYSYKTLIECRDNPPSDFDRKKHWYNWFLLLDEIEYLENKDVIE